MPPCSDLQCSSAMFRRVTEVRRLRWIWLLPLLLVLGQWLGAQVIDWFPKGPLRVDARSVHIVFGALLAILIVARLVWRRTRGRELPHADRGRCGCWRPLFTVYFTPSSSPP